MFLKSCLALSILTAYQPTENEKVINPPPKIISIYTDYPKAGFWVQIPKGTKKITFNVKADNTETVLFWLMPTGTQTWNQRELIGHDIKQGGKDNQFSFTWTLNKTSLLDHLQIQALGDGIANETINLIME